MLDRYLGRLKLKKVSYFSVLVAVLVVLSLGNVPTAWAGDAKLKAVKIPRHMQAGLNYAGYVTLDKPAPAGGVIISMASDAEDEIAMPYRFMVREGQKTGRFPIHVREIARSNFSNIAVTDGENVLKIKARVMPAPALSRTVMQRQVKLRWRVSEY